MTKRCLNRNLKWKTQVFGKHNIWFLKMFLYFIILCILLIGPQFFRIVC